MLPAEIRSAHPYFMYEEIHAQPDVVAAALATSTTEIARVGEAAALARRIVLVGCGTSFHAAWVGQYFFENFLPDCVTRAAIAHELLHSGPAIEPEDLVIGLSHSGGTATTIAALEKAHQAGARTVAVTGFPQSSLAYTVQHVIATGYELEKSWAHTASYTASLVILARLALEAGGQRRSNEAAAELSHLPEKVRAALGLAPRMQEFARRHRDRRRFIFVGSGPNWPSAAEAALKMQETNYSHAEGMEVEQLLHGPLASVDENTVVVLLAPEGLASARFLDVARAARMIGSLTLAVVGPGQEALADACDDSLQMPSIAELLSPILFAVPAQLLSYYLAVERGVNPDLLHRHEKKYLEARASYVL